MNILFTGLGSIGQRHLRNLLELYPNTRIIALRRHRRAPLLDDKNQAVAHKSIEEQYPIQVVSTMEEAVSLELDAAVISSPSSLHASDAAALIKNSTRCLIEKPVATCLSDLQQLQEIEHFHGYPLIDVSFQYRQSPCLRHIKQLLTKGAIGTVVSARFINGEYLPFWHKYENYKESYASRRDLGGGAIKTQIHDIDYSMWLLGKPRSVSCIGGQLSNLSVDVEDSVQLLFEVQSNDHNVFPCMITLDYLSWPPSRELTIIGDEGRIDCDLNKGIVSISSIENNTHDTLDFSSTTRDMLFRSVMDNFISFVQGKSLPSASLSDAAVSLICSCAAEDSLCSNGQRISIS